MIARARRTSHLIMRHDATRVSDAFRREAMIRVRSALSVSRALYSAAVAVLICNDAAEVA
jgi:hypothetical protein